VPSARALGWIDQEPPVRVADSVCTGEPDTPEPAYTFTVTVAESPLPAPAAPLSVGVVSLVRNPTGREVSVTPGWVVSTVKVRGALYAVTPLLSSWVEYAT
jgi:hypothetical protein